MTQTDQVLRHLKRKKSLSSLTALTEYGIMRLASRIHDLKRAGVKIKREKREIIKRNGESVVITEYSLA